MTPQELRAALALSLIFFLRMLGLFMLLPVLALYADQLAGATPTLIGLALGVYGLTQATLQIPMGTLSDRIGRKPVIALGLIIFALGGVLGACATHVITVVAARAVQGAGAISGTALALAADLSRSSQRTKVMAIIGVCIGTAFSVAFVVGPVLDAWVGLDGLFWISASLGVVALPVLFVLVPQPPATTVTDDLPPEGLLKLVRSPVLRSLYAGVFCLHLILAASFVSIPVLLAGALAIPSDQHYSIYIPVIVISVLCVAPLFVLSARSNLAAPLFRAAIVCIGIAEGLLWLAHLDRMLTIAALTIFFTGFNFLEASLPSAISTATAAQRKGAALGTYSTAQFVGMFAGGVVGGVVADLAGPAGVFGMLCALACGWVVYSMRHPMPATRAAAAT